jgi:hypothetical protein
VAQALLRLAADAAAAAAAVMIIISDVTSMM